MLTYDPNDVGKTGIGVRELHQEKRTTTVISGFLFGCAISALKLGTYLAYLFDKTKRDNIDSMLTSAYVLATDFKGHGLMRRAADRYVQYLGAVSRRAGASHFSLCRTLGFGWMVGLAWVLMLWISLHGDLWSVRGFFQFGNLTAALLVGVVAIGFVFVIDVQATSVLAKAISKDHPIVRRPWVPAVLSVILFLFSWSFLGGIFAATALLGPALRGGDFPIFFFNIPYLMNRWWVAFTHPIAGGLEIKLLSTGRYISGNAFALPAAIASCSLLFMVLATSIGERYASSITSKAATMVNLAHGQWTVLDRLIPKLDVTMISRAVAAVFFVLALWAAASGL